jgi:hypothetical protein
VAFFPSIQRGQQLPDIVAFKLSQILEELLVFSRHRLAQFADRAEYFVRVEAARRDPDRRAWAAQRRAALDDGSLLREVEAQRAPEEILREWLTTASS